MKRIGFLAGLVCFLVGSVFGADGKNDATPYAYHLRIVHVSGADIDPGAALGWTENGGVPVVLPGDEAWGTEVQIGALAHVLAGERADAVTGYYVMADQGGAHFDRRVYVAGSVVDLSFEARPPSGKRKQHLLTLKLDLPELEEPMAEARLLVRTERTVAIASPTAVEKDWLVLAVTLVDQDRIDELRKAEREIRSPDDDGVVKPRLIHKVSPKYPEGARKEMIQGDVAVMATIDKQGIPRAPTVVEMSPGAEELAAAAVDTVLDWRYEPATLNGEPVEVMVTVTVRFKLE